MRTALSGLNAPVVSRLPARLLVALFVFTACALAGYSTFGLHPELMARFPQFANFYSIAFLFFAQAQIWLSWAALALFLTAHQRLQWLPAFLALYLVSLGSELLGTTLGIPFGEYRYTEALGPMWFAHVPVVIPLSWFFMAIPSFAVARAVLPRHALGRVLMASLVLLSWDLALDPAMSHATTYWVWAESGAYYGMPWLNLFGWYVTGLALMTVLSLLHAERWISPLPLGWLVGFYVANLLLPLGMSAAAGLWGAVVATLGALAVTALLAWTLTSNRRAHSAGAEVWT